MEKLAHWINEAQSWRRTHSIWKQIAQTEKPIACVALGARREMLTEDISRECS
jgi:hypothetical protein